MVNEACNCRYRCIRRMNVNMASDVELNVPPVVCIDMYNIRTCISVRCFGPRVAPCCANVILAHLDFKGQALIHKRALDV